MYVNTNFQENKVSDSILRALHGSRQDGFSAVILLSWVHLACSPFKEFWLTDPSMLNVFPQTSKWYSLSSDLCSDTIWLELPSLFIFVKEPFPFPYYSFALLLFLIFLFNTYHLVSLTLGLRAVRTETVNSLLDFSSLEYIQGQIYKMLIRYLWCEWTIIIFKL